MKLVLGGLTDADLNYVDDIRQWCLLNRTDKKFVYDVINVHRYTSGVSPEQGMIRETMQAIVDYRNQYLPDVEVWITEFGWDSGINDTPFSCPSIGNSNREEVQACWIIREYLLLSSTGIERAAQYMLRDVDNDGKTQFETCGLVNEKNDWQPKSFLVLYLYHEERFERHCILPVNRTHTTTMYLFTNMKMLSGIL